jgi:hypothetical protein
VSWWQNDLFRRAPAKHIAIADSKYHLGTADPQKIELIKIGYDKESFV